MTQSSFINIVYVIFFPTIQLHCATGRRAQVPPNAGTTIIIIGCFDRFCKWNCFHLLLSASSLCLSSFLCCVVLLLYTVFPLIKYEKSTLSHEIDCGSAGAGMEKFHRHKWGGTSHIIISMRQARSMGNFAGSFFLLAYGNLLELYSKLTFRLTRVS